MRIVFSRKGLDSAAGGIPSPLIEGRPLSVPIPANGTPSGCRYGDLASPIPELLDDLDKGPGRADRCHLDPDIDAAILRGPRPSGWRGSLGQVGAAQSHLANQGVGRDDVFVFWGLFRPVERAEGGWRFVGKPQHRIFGWLQVAEVLVVGEDWRTTLGRYPWLKGHPHLRAGWGPRNTVYIAAETLRLGGSDTGLAGFGAPVPGEEPKRSGGWRGVQLERSRVARFLARRHRYDLPSTRAVAGGRHTAGGAARSGVRGGCGYAHGRARMARNLDRRGRNRGLTRSRGRPSVGGVLLPLAAGTLFLLGAVAWRFRPRNGPARLGLLPSAALGVAACVYLVVWTGRLVAGGNGIPSLPWGDPFPDIDASPLLPVQLAVVALAGALAYPRRANRLEPVVGAAALCGVVAGMLILGGLGFAWGAAAVSVSHVILYVVLGWELIVLGAISVAVHALAGNRLAGTLAMLLVLLWEACAVGLGFEHVLYRPGLPESPDAQVTVGAYWSAFAVLLVLLAQARRRFTPRVRSAAALAGVTWLGLGVWIFYNTNVLNPYETAADIAAHRAEYETRFGRFAELPTPEVLALDLAVDIHPEGREVRSRGSMLLGNTGGARITEFVVSFPRSLRVDALSIPATLVERADDLGARRYAFDPPLRPIERVRMTFDVVGKHARDRTFLAASDILPFPGYDAALAPANDRLRLTARLGMRLDHEGVAPGRLVRAWRENDRSYFEYEAETLAWADLSFGSRPPCGHADGARVESSGGSLGEGGGGAQARGSCDGALLRERGLGGGEERVLR